jgi:hypothetical protein
MRLLQRVIAAGSIQLVMSRMVLREYETKRMADLSSRTQGAKDSLKEITKIFTKANQEIPKLENLDTHLTNLLPELRIRLEETTQSWLDDFKVTVFDAHPDIYERIWDDYFSGKGTFKRPKNRDDIPDAVIGRSLERLISDGSPLTFICKDGQLKEFMGGLPNVRVFNELSDLIRSPDFEKMLNELDAQDMVIEEFKAVIGSDTFLNNIMKYFSANESDFSYSYWEDGMIENQGELPLPVFGGVSAGGPIASSIKDEKFGPVACINPRHYVISVAFSADMPISFVGDYADWIHASDEVKRSVEIESANGDGACEFGIVKRSTVTGEIVVHLLESEEPQSLLIHSKYIGIGGSPLDVEFVPTKVIL